VWLKPLLNIYDAYVGKPRRDLNERLCDGDSRESFLPKQKLAIHILNHWAFPKKINSGLLQKIRAIVFSEAAKPIHENNRQSILAKASEHLKISPEEIEDQVFSDLSKERRL